MLGDKKCDSVCYNQACEWDKLDCGCAANCAFADLASCKPECMVADCNYGLLPGYPACTSEITRVSYKYYQILQFHKTFEFAPVMYDFYLKCSISNSCTNDARAASFTTCTSTQCNYENCIYSFGNCVSLPNCNAGYTEIINASLIYLLCLQCTPPYLNSMGSCQLKCSEGLTPHWVLTDLCILEEDLTSQAHPDLLFVSPDYTASDADGSETRPFTTLAVALANTFRHYTQILLKGNPHFLTPSVSSMLLEDSSLNQRTRSIRDQQVELRINSYDCYNALSEDCERAVIYIDTSLPVRLLAPKVQISYITYPSKIDYGALYISNVEFAANDTLYCLRLDLCSFITLEYSSVFLRNVTFRNITGLNSIISFRQDNKVSLENVEFNNVTCLAACIWQDSSTDSLALIQNLIRTLPGDFIFNNGRVTMGSEVFDMSRFLLLTNISEAVVDGVTFINSDVRSANFSFIEIQSCYKFTMRNSVIANNKMGLSSPLYVSTFIWDLDQGEELGPKYFNSTNFLLMNVTFRDNTYFTEPAVKFIFMELPQTIFMENITFQNEYSRSGNLIDISSIAPVNGTRIRGPSEYTLDRKRRIDYPPSRIDLRNIIFANVSTLSNSSMIYIKYLTFLDIDDVTLIGNSLSGTSSYRLLLVDSSYWIVLQHVKVRGVQCGADTNIIEVTNSTGTVSLLHSDFSDIKSGGVLVIDDSEALNLTDVSFVNCVTAFSVVKLSRRAAFAMLSRMHMQGNRAGSSGALLLAQLAIVTISDSTFANNTSAASDGGTIILNNAQSSRMSIEISSCVFAGNKVLGSGGAIRFDFTPSIFTLVLHISDSHFDGNTANAGAAVSIPLGITVMSTSAILNTTFIKHFAETDGVLSLHYSAGSMRITECVFKDNRGTREAGLLAGYLSAVDGTSTWLQLESVVFENNIGTTVVRVPRAPSASDLIASGVRFVGNSGCCLFVENGNIIASNISFVGNAANSSPAVALTQSAVGRFSTSAFENNTATESVGAVRVSEFASFDCAKCRFVGNRAQQQAGAMQVEQHAVLRVTDSLFAKNEAGQDGAALYILLTNANSFISNCTFESNLSGGDATIVVFSSSVEVRNSTLKENRTQKITPGITSTMSRVAIYDSDFTSQDGSSGVYVYAKSLSLVNVSNSNFRNAKCSEYGAFYIDESTLEVHRSNFSNISAGSGSAVYAFNHASVSIHISSFATQANKKAGAITVILASALLEDSHFHDFRNSAVWGQGASLFVGNSIFEGNSHAEGTGSEGVAVYCTQCTQIAVARCAFRVLEGEIGSGISLWNKVANSNVYEVSDCWFAGTRGVRGAGVFANNVWMRMQRNHFVNNSAEGDQSSGGAVALACSSGNCSYVLESNSFLNNTAGMSGGAIAWRDQMPELTGNVFDGNSALYGDDKASFATHLVTRNGSFLTEVPSGQPAPYVLLLSLLDHYNQTVSIDNETKAEVILAQNQWNVTIYGTTEIRATSGSFRFDSFTIAARPGTTTFLHARIVGDTAFLLFTVSIRPCKIGESLVDDKCIVCEPGKFSFDPTQPCQDCPPEATCKGNFTVIPRPGYWRSNYLHKIFFQCPNSDACLGPPAVTGTCAEGYEGNKCQSCAEDFSRVSKVHCSPCPSRAARIAKLVGFLLLIIAFSAALVITSIKSAYKPKSMQSVFLKILMNYFQLVMLMGGFNLSWPSLVKQLLEIQDSAGGFTEQLFAIDCLGEKYKETDEFFSKLLTMALVPLIFILCSSIVWALVAAIKQSLDVLKKELVGSAVILFFLVHPSVIRVMFSAFNCEEIDPGEYWVSGLEIRCWQGEHWKYALGLALPSIIVWGVCVPALVLLMLVTQRKSLSQSGHKVRFGYLFNGYTPHRYYWEFIVIYRKLLIIAISLFLSQVSRLLQALLAFVILLVSLYLHHEYSPYTQSSLNTMEHRSLLVSTLTLFAGLYYLDGTIGSTLEMVFQIGVLLANLYFLQFWVRKSANAWLVLLVRKAKFLQRYLAIVNDSRIVLKSRPRIASEDQIAIKRERLLPEFMRLLYVKKLTNGPDIK